MALRHPSFRKMYPIALLFLTLNALVTEYVLAATPSGGYFTQEELNIWKQRAQSGPYKSKGDVSTNSPDDWNRIKGHGDSFVSNPSADRWPGGSDCGGGCMKRECDNDMARQTAYKIRDAAFVYLVTGQTQYRDAVRNELLNYYLPHPKMKWADRTRWCVGQNGYNENGFQTATMLQRIFGAYKIVRHTMTSVQRASMDQWFLNAGIYWYETQDLYSLHGKFADRENGVFRDPSAMAQTQSYTHDGGYAIPLATYFWNNRRSGCQAFAAEVGVFYNNSTLTNATARYFKEWVKYSVFPDGTHGEMYKADIANDHEVGLAYTWGNIYAMISIADEFARAGDKSLYEYTTSEGIGQTKGGKKNLKLAITNALNYMDGTLKRYKFGGLIDGKNGNWETVGNIFVSRANVYYKDDYIKGAYLRTNPGTRPYPASPATPFLSIWGGPDLAVPGMLFMFGQMEGKVWPYGKSASASQPPSKPVTPGLEKR